MHIHDRPTYENEAATMTRAALDTDSRMRGGHFAEVCETDDSEVYQFKARYCNK